MDLLLMDLSISKSSLTQAMHGHPTFLFLAQPNWGGQTTFIMELNCSWEPHGCSEVLPKNNISC